MLAKSNIAKGSTGTLTITRSEVLALFSSDPYFSLVENCNKIVLHYKSSVGGQRKDVIFDGDQATASRNIKFSSRARDIFQVAKITVYDYDEGFAVVRREDFSQPMKDEMDINMTTITALWSHSFNEPALYGQGIFAGSISEGKLVFNKAFNTPDNYSLNPTISFAMQGTGPQILVPQSVGPLTRYNFRIYVSDILPPEGLTELRLANGGGTYVYIKNNAEITNDIATKGYIEFTNFTIWDASGSLELKIPASNIAEVVLKMTRFEIHSL